MIPRPCVTCASSRLCTTDQHRSGTFNATTPLCLRRIGRSPTPMNTHVNGGGSVQLGSIRNPDSPTVNTATPAAPIYRHRLHRHRRIPDRASDVRPTNHTPRGGTLSMKLRVLHAHRESLRTLRPENPHGTQRHQKDNLR